MNQKVFLKETYCTQNTLSLRKLIGGSTSTSAVALEYVFKFVSSEIKSDCLSAYFSILKTKVWVTFELELVSKCKARMYFACSL